MPRNNSTAKIREDLAVIKNQIVNLSDNFDEFKVEQRKFYESTTIRVTILENAQGVLNQKVSNLAIFQSTFSVIIGGIATVLGIKK